MKLPEGVRFDPRDPSSVLHAAHRANVVLSLSIQDKDGNVTEYSTVSRISPRTGPVDWPEEEWPESAGWATAPSASYGAAVHGWRVLSWYLGDSIAHWAVRAIHELGPAHGGRFVLLGACVAACDLAAESGGSSFAALTTLLADAPESLPEAFRSYVASMPPTHANARSSGA